jgi:hypothetical protein
MVEHAKFRRLVGPDEELRLSASLRSSRDGTFAVDAEATMAGERVANARLVFRSFTFALPEAGSEAFVAWARKTFIELAGPSVLGSGDQS